MFYRRHGCGKFITVKPKRSRSITVGSSFTKRNPQRLSTTHTNLVNPKPVLPQSDCVDNDIAQQLNELVDGQVLILSKDGRIIKSKPSQQNRIAKINTSPKPNPRNLQMVFQRKSETQAQVLFSLPPKSNKKSRRATTSYSRHPRKQN